MSADDGWILRKNDKGKFVLQHYMGDSMPDVNSEHALQFDTLEEAMIDYQDREGQSAYPSEYGLTVRLKTATERRRFTHSHYEDDPETCTEFCST